MKFDPIAKKLYTDSGEFIKTLHCPLKMRWESLSSSPASPHPICSECERTVLDTALMTDPELLSAVRADPAVCLYVSARQENVTIFRLESDA